MLLHPAHDPLGEEAAQLAGVEEEAVVDERQGEGPSQRNAGRGHLQVDAALILRREAGRRPGRGAAAPEVAEGERGAAGVLAGELVEQVGQPRGERRRLARRRLARHPRAEPVEVARQRREQRESETDGDRHHESQQPGPGTDDRR